MALSRRALLAGLAAVSSSAWPSASFGAEELAPAAPGAPVLVCLCLRGAMDGLSLCVPHAEPRYYEARPSIAVARPGERGGALDLDGRFGLHPRLAPLLPAFRAGELAMVHAVGSPHPTRSHFEAQDYLETGLVGVRSARQGWLGRSLAARPRARVDGIPAVVLSSRAPLALRGFQGALSANDLGEFKLAAPRAVREPLQRGFEKLYAARDDEGAQAGKLALSVAERLKPVTGKQAGHKAVDYPKQGAALRQAAALIKADLGVEAIWLDVGGWDTHRFQGNGEEGELARSFDRLGKSLAAFRADLGALLERVVVLVMTEFGRTVRENGTGGTDHGHGSAMLVLGGRVKGNRVYGAFPGLEAEHCFEGRDLAVTTDYRDVLAEILEKQVGVSNPSRLFPGYALDPSRRLGILG